MSTSSPLAVVEVGWADSGSGVDSKWATVNVVDAGSAVVVVASPPLVFSAAAAAVILVIVVVVAFLAIEIGIAASSVIVLTSASCEMDSKRLFGGLMTSEGKRRRDEHFGTSSPRARAAASSS